MTKVMGLNPILWTVLRSFRALFIGIFLSGRVVPYAVIWKAFSLLYLR